MQGEEKSDTTIKVCGILIQRFMISSCKYHQEEQVKTGGIIRIRCGRCPHVETERVLTIFKFS